ncbi:MAG: helix-turn-helix domain-containing protein [Alphaproteobacteria bacterium]|nr:helix-turn-helix domain-containing protein [Alphaproteobacteria bacterium]
MTDVEKGGLGQRFEDFLKEEGTYDQSVAIAAKRVIAWQLRQIMEEQNISRVAMAEQLQTSRSQMNRLLDPENDAVTLATLTRAAQAVGRTLRLELV